MVLAPIFRHIPVVVRGGGDLGSGVVFRLHRAGFCVVVTELEKPVFVRRAVCFGAAVYEERIAIDGIVSQKITDCSDAPKSWDAGEVPVIIDPNGIAVRELSPVVVVDARMAKDAQDTSRSIAPLVIGLGPGFEAGENCHAVIETNRGHYLGRVIWHGRAEPDTGEPGRVNGIGSDRVLRAPAAGYVESASSIGDAVNQGDEVAVVGGVTVRAQVGGVVRGLVHSSVWVTVGMKIGDIDPRADRDHCFTISDKSLAVGGGVLEAILSSESVSSALHG